MYFDQGRRKGQEVTFIYYVRHFKGHLTYFPITSGIQNGLHIVIKTLPFLKTKAVEENQAVSICLLQETLSFAHVK